MISDSPYQVEGFVLLPVAGFVAGLVAAFIVVATVYLLRPLSGLTVAEVFGQFGRVVVPRSREYTESTLLPAGLALHEFTGGLLGLLYAVSQRRIAAGGVVGVGVLYGFVIWVVSNVIASLFYRGTLRAAIHSWAWLVSCLIYGLCLAGCAIAVNRRRPASVAMLPRD